MNNLEFSIKQLTVHNQDGSQATRANRHRGLMAIAGELHGLGFKLKSVHNLKPRHIEALVGHWKTREITDETIRNRLGWIRWVGDHIGKGGLIPKDNAEFGLAERTPYQGSKARRLDADTLARVRDEAIR